MNCLLKHKGTIDFVVLRLAMALAVFGFGCFAFIAFLKADIILAAMVLVAVVMFFVAMIPAYRMLKTTQRMAK